MRGNQSSHWLSSYSPKCGSNENTLQKNTFCKVNVLSFRRSTASSEITFMLFKHSNTMQSDWQVNWLKTKKSGENEKTNLIVFIVEGQKWRLLKMLAQRPTPCCLLSLYLTRLLDFRMETIRTFAPKEHKTSRLINFEAWTVNWIKFLTPAYPSHPSINAILTWIICFWQEIWRERSSRWHYSHQSNRVCRLVHYLLDVKSTNCWKESLDESLPIITSSFIIRHTALMLT